MPHRNGKKFGGEHTTYIELAAQLADIAVRLPEVKNISAGIVQGGKGVAGGDRRIKFCDMVGGLLCKVRQSRSVQEVRILTTDPGATRLALARAVLNELRAGIAFQKPS